MKKLFLIFVFCVGLFANDATMTIVNEGVSLPKIVVQNASELPNSEFNNKFFKLMVTQKMNLTFMMRCRVLIINQLIQHTVFRKCIKKMFVQ